MIAGPTERSRLVKVVAMSPEFFYVFPIKAERRNL